MPIIAVLEDDQRRITSIHKIAQLEFANYQLRIFLSARDMIAWLSDEPPDIKLISLDCDLDLTAVHDDNCGSGEDVSAFLARNPIDCPILIHSSNAMGAPAMHMELVLAGYKSIMLRPFRDSQTWAADVNAQLTSAPQSLS